MNVVVAGGTGLIGTHLINRLSSDGHSVVLLTRGPARVPRSIGKEATAVAWDGRTVGIWIDHIERAEGVVNLAGESIGAGRWTATRKKRMVTSRVDATRTIVRAIAQAKNKPKVLVNASGAGYYGDVAEGDVMEEMPAGNDFLAETCQQWEGAAREAERSGTRVVMIRTGFVIARDAPAFKKMLLPFKLFAGGPYGSGRQWFPWVHIDDIVGAYQFALQRGDLRGPVNVAAPDAKTIRHFTKLLGQVMRRPAWAPAPAFALRIVLGEMADLLLKGQKLSPQKLLGAGFTFRFPEAENALRNVLAA